MNRLLAQSYCRIPILTIVMLTLLACKARAFGLTGIKITGNLGISKRLTSNVTTSFKLLAGCQLYPRISPYRSNNGVRSRVLTAPLYAERSLSSNNYNLDKDHSDDEMEERTNTGAYERGQRVEIRVMRFGPLGATVGIDGTNDQGLVKQADIAEYRDIMGVRDVHLGDRLSGYIDRILENGKLDIKLRPVGVDQLKGVAQVILAALESAADHSIPIGDRSTAEEVEAFFRRETDARGRQLRGEQRQAQAQVGVVSKTVFKRAVGILFKEGKVKPGDSQTFLVPEGQRVPAPTPATAASAPCTLFVGNLPPRATEEALRRALGEKLPAQAIGRIRMKVGEAGGYGFVDVRGGEAGEAWTQFRAGALQGLKVGGRLARVDDAINSKVSAVGTSGVSRADRDDLAAGRAKSKHSNARGLDQDRDAEDNEGAGAGAGRGYGRKDRDERPFDNGRGAPRPDGRNRDGGWREAIGEAEDGASRDRGASSSPLKFYLGNLPYETDEAELQQYLQQCAGVAETERSLLGSVRICRERETQRSRGFGYVTVFDPQLAARLERGVQQRDLQGRQIRIDRDDGGDARTSRGDSGGAGGWDQRRQGRREGEGVGGDRRRWQGQQGHQSDWEGRSSAGGRAGSRGRDGLRGGGRSWGSAEGPGSGRGGGMRRSEDGPSGCGRGGGSRGEVRRDCSNSW